MKEKIDSIIPGLSHTVLPKLPKLGDSIRNTNSTMQLDYIDHIAIGVDIVDFEETTKWYENTFGQSLK